MRTTASDSFGAAREERTMGRPKVWAPMLVAAAGLWLAGCGGTTSTHGSTTPAPGYAPAVQGTSGGAASGYALTGSAMPEAEVDEDAVDVARSGPPPPAAAPAPSVVSQVRSHGPLLAQADQTRPEPPGSGAAPEASPTHPNTPRPPPTPSRTVARCSSTRPTSPWPSTRCRRASARSSPSHATSAASSRSRATRRSWCACRRGSSVMPSGA